MNTDEVAELFCSFNGNIFDNIKERLITDKKSGNQHMVWLSWKSPSLLRREILF